MIDERTSCPSCGRVAEYGIGDYKVGDRVVVLGCTRYDTPGEVKTITFISEADIAYVDATKNEGWWPCHMTHLPEVEYQEAVNILGEEYFA